MDATAVCAVEELGAFSGEADLLNVGSRSYGPIRRLIGTAGARLARRARSPLLVLALVV